MHSGLTIVRQFGVQRKNYEKSKFCIEISDSKKTEV